MGGTLALLAGPAFIAAAAADVGNPSANTYWAVKQIRVNNSTAVAATFTAFLGATGGSAAGTEVSGASQNVPASDYVTLDFYPALKVTAAQFLSAICQTGASKLTIEVLGEKWAV